MRLDSVLNYNYEFSSQNQYHFHFYDNYLGVFPFGLCSKLHDQFHDHHCTLPTICCRNLGCFLIAFSSD